MNFCLFLISSRYDAVEFTNFRRNSKFPHHYYDYKKNDSVLNKIRTVYYFQKKKTQGRVLPREKIIFANREVEVDDKADWTRPAGNEAVVKAVDITNWLVVYPAQKEQVVERFVTLAMDCSRKIGIRLEMPRTVAMRDDRPDTYYSEIKKNLNDSVRTIV